LTQLRSEAVWSGRHLSPDRARRLRGAARSRTSRHAARTSPRSAVRPRNDGFAEQLCQRRCG